MAVVLPDLPVADTAARAGRLDDHDGDSAGVRLVPGREDTTDPTSLVHQDAVVEALCHGGVGGQVTRRDESTYRVRTTPRRPRSTWSQADVARTAVLQEQGRMRPRGAREVAAGPAATRRGERYPWRSRMRTLRRAQARERRVAALTALLREGHAG